MQTSFASDLLADPEFAESERVVRTCVHCGFCTATCPTYVLLGDELDSPRGRIYLMKDMLEKNRPADAETVKHIDRCLSCLACMTTCPSGVNYMHLVDHARHQPGFAPTKGHRGASHPNAPTLSAPQTNRPLVRRGALRQIASVHLPRVAHSVPTSNCFHQLGARK
jgi:Fe-S oxidoreductase